MALDDREDMYDALVGFSQKPHKDIPDKLENLLTVIAQNGEPIFPWTKLRPLVIQKLENVIQEYIESNPDENIPVLPNVENLSLTDMKDRLVSTINKFHNAPFTIQRICELLTEPKKYYQRSDKFMRGIEKNILIVTTVTPSGKRITSSSDVARSTPMVNGILTDGNIPHAPQAANGSAAKETEFRVPSTSTLPNTNDKSNAASKSETQSQLELAPNLPHGAASDGSSCDSTQVQTETDSESSDEPIAKKPKIDEDHVDSSVTANENLSELQETQKWHSAEKESLSSDCHQKQGQPDTGDQSVKEDKVDSSNSEEENKAELPSESSENTQKVSEENILQQSESHDLSSNGESSKPSEQETTEMVLQQPCKNESPGEETQNETGSKGPSSSRSSEQPPGLVQSDPSTALPLVSSDDAHDGTLGDDGDESMEEGIEADQASDDEEDKENLCDHNEAESQSAPEMSASENSDSPQSSAEVSSTNENTE